MICPLTMSEEVARKKIVFVHEIQMQITRDSPCKNTILHTELIVSTLTILKYCQSIGATNRRMFYDEISVAFAKGTILCTDQLVVIASERWLPTHILNSDSCTRKLVTKIESQPPNHSIKFLF